MLIYGILFVSALIAQIRPGMPRREAEKAVMNLALDNNFAIPGDAGFPLNQAFEAPKDRGQAETLRGYVSQMRQELAVRLLERVYADGDSPSKVSVLPCVSGIGLLTFVVVVVVEFQQEEIHGQVTMIKPIGDDAVKAYDKVGTVGRKSFPTLIVRYRSGLWHQSEANGIQTQALFCIALSMNLQWFALRCIAARIAV